MGKWVHRALECDPLTGMGVCLECGPVRFVRRSHDRWGCSIVAKAQAQSWRSTEAGRAYLREKSRRKGPTKKRRRARALADACVLCGFVPLHPEQLQIDHKDGDRSHNAQSNLWTLCANCHALKTALDAGRVALRGPLPPLVVALIRALE